MGVPKNELGINRGNKSGNRKKGGCRTRNGDALNSALSDITPKTAFGKNGGQ
jgi:hypothetical protein